MTSVRERTVSRPYDKENKTNSQVHHAQLDERFLLIDKYSMPVIEWLNRYLGYMESRLLANTFEQKMMVFKRFIMFVDSELEISEMTALVAVEYFEREAKRRTACAASKDLSILDVAWKWGGKNLGLAKANPFVLTDKYPVDENQGNNPDIGV
jgi:hypothetical protein